MQRPPNRWGGRAVVVLDVAAYLLDVAEAKASTAEKATNAARTPVMTMMVSVDIVSLP